MNTHHARKKSDRHSVLATFHPGMQTWRVVLHAITVSSMFATQTSLPLDVDLFKAPLQRLES